MKRVQARVRAQVLDHYGRRCACCGERNERFLTIDHVEGGGHRQRVDGVGWGTSFYRWLIDQGFPEEFQTLCFNCNCGRALNGGVCPHEEVDGG